MKTRSSRRGLGIRLRIVFLAAVPLLVIALLIGGYTVQARLADARQGLDERGRIVADNLAMAAEFALFSQDLERLRSLCRSALRQPDVTWAGVRDADGDLLAEGGSDAGMPGASGLFRAPMGAKGVQLTDFADETGGDAPSRPMGWAEVRLSLDGTLARQREIVVRSLIIVAGGLLLSLIAALRIGRGISRPLLELSRLMGRYREGDHGVRIATPAGGEVGELARDFNRMAKALEGSQARLREEVRAATEALNRTVEALSAKNAQLETAHEAALEAGREKYEFLARMSHEIRTPLNAVIGFSRLLRDDPGGHGTLEYTQTIDRAANQLLYVIDGILNFTKLETGNLDLERLPFDPRVCLEDAVVMLSRAAHEKSLELALAMHQEIPETLRGDPNRIVQVLLNLLNNAIKFTAAGQVLVEARYAPDGAGGGSLEVVVSDTGIGLSDEGRGRLFQPFVQADSAITRRYGGTGLGLIICKRLIELMGGTIGVESAPGEGSRFAISIPCLVDTGPVLALSSEFLKGRRVLVYDRQAIQSRALATLLHAWSMNVCQVGTSERLPGVLKGAAATGRPFSLLLLGLDAEESSPERFESLMMELRGYYAGPVLVLVGAEQWQVPKNALWQGSLGWTSKPVRRSVLHRCLRELIGQTQAQVATEITRDSLPPRFAGLRVLVVEDNAFNRLLLRRLLERRGAEVQEACDGAEAVVEIDRSPYDLVFMDIHMPGTDGIETARRIRSQRGDRPCPPIVALTADVFAGERNANTALPFDGFLLKPLSESALDETILLAVDQTRGGEPQSNSTVALQPVRPSEPKRLPVDLDGQLRLELERLCGRLEAATAHGRRDNVRELAHEFKGLCGFFGLEALQDPVRELELVASEAPIMELRDRIQELRRLIGRSR